MFGKIDNIIRRFAKKIFLSFDFLNIVLFVTVLGIIILKFWLENNSSKTMSVLFSALNIFCVLIAVLYIEALNVNNTYKSWGRLSKWYDKTLEWKGTKWLCDLFDDLTSKEILEFEGELKFISPSANKGFYEKALFKYLQDINRVFIASDINEFEEFAESETTENGRFIHIDKATDAKDIKGLLKSLKINKVNVIFDLIGYMWHVKEGTWYNKSLCTKKLTEILETYKEVLEDNGLIILDNVKSTKVENVIRQFNNFVNHGKLDIGEQSTGSYIIRISKTDKNNILSRYIDSNFETYIINETAANGKEISSLVLKKKVG